MAILIDGKTISQQIRDEVAKDVDVLKKQGIKPHLTVILVGDNPASQVYVQMKAKACNKAGISSETLTFAKDTTETELLKVIDQLNNNKSVNAILVQLPLPKQIREDVIINRISPEKDVDGLHPINVGKLASGADDGFFPATPAGIVELLVRSGFSPEGKHVVIVGRSNLVSKPLGLLLLRKGKNGNATVTFCHSKTVDLDTITRSADILVAAIGSPEMIRKDMVKPGAIVIDVGVNRIETPTDPKGYRIVGDVHFEEVSKVAKAITPVPGGVGPMTIALLLKNTLQASKNRIQ